MMKKSGEARITICTAPPGLYAVVKDMERPKGADVPRTVEVVTAFKYTYYNDETRVFSEPLVYCRRKNTNALVSGRTKIEFVGSLENCTLKIKELITTYYAGRTAKKNALRKALLRK